MFRKNGTCSALDWATANRSRVVEKSILATFYDLFSVKCLLSIIPAEPHVGGDNRILRETIRQWCVSEKKGHWDVSADSKRCFGIKSNNNTEPCPAETVSYWRE